MKLYMHPVSTASRPVRLFIAEKKHRRSRKQVVDLMTGEHYKAALSPPSIPSRRCRCWRTATSA